MNVMKTLRRDDKVTLIHHGNRRFELRNRNDVVADANSEYFIYMKNVTFKNGWLIQGRYLGELVKGDSIIDEYCKEIEIIEGDFVVNNKSIKTARMVAINNKNNMILIIPND